MSKSSSKDICIDKCIKTVGIPNGTSPISLTLTGIVLSTTTPGAYTGTFGIVLPGPDLSTVVVSATVPAGLQTLLNGTVTILVSPTAPVGSTTPILSGTITGITVTGFPGLTVDGVTITGGSLIITNDTGSDALTNIGTLLEPVTASGVLIGAGLPIVSYTPIFNAAVGVPANAKVTITNSGSSYEAIYAFSSQDPITLPTAVPSLASAPGIGGLVTILSPGCQTFLAMNDLVLLFSVPIVTAAGSSSSTGSNASAISADLKLSFPFNEIVGGLCCPTKCDTKISVVQTTPSVQGMCGSGISQALFTSINKSPRFTILELSNEGTCDVVISYTRADESVPTNLFPSMLPTVTPSLSPKQMEIVILTDLVQLNVISLSSSASEESTGDSSNSSNTSTSVSVDDLATNIRSVIRAYFVETASQVKVFSTPMKITDVSTSSHRSSSSSKSKSKSKSKSYRSSSHKSKRSDYDVLTFN